MVSILCLLLIPKQCICPFFCGWCSTTDKDEWIGSGDNMPEVKKQKSLTARELKRKEWWSRQNQPEPADDVDEPKKKSDQSKSEQKQATKNKTKVDEKLKMSKKRQISEITPSKEESDSPSTNAQSTEPKTKKIKTDNLTKKQKSSKESNPTSSVFESTEIKTKKIKTDKSAKKQKSSTELESNPASSTVQSTEPNKKKKAKAYVLFVGNLPYDATEETVKEHFIRTGGVKAVRLLTNKESGKSRGCAYVEFEDSKAHKFGLKLHESLLGERKINVEFTSPGRNTPKRIDRLKEKNRRAARLKHTYDPSS